MSEDVVFKGSRSGLQLIFDETVDFTSILKQLKTKLESAIDFFGKGTIVNVAIDKITKEQETELSILFQRYGLTLKAIDTSLPKVSELKSEEAAVEASKEITIIERTVRGGQEIISNGSVVILGNVNPGAKIIAGGNIDIKGTCRGLVHAGAFGDLTATITADKMLAMQIRIADLIARAPDNLETVDTTECARIKNGNIVIETVNRQEVC
ncbi:MAG: septum site-determining protein minC [Massilibacillus sp.]|jgi:septum site-determining protein MinC|nr:septum site-determining protein minC [Massilibacillus sp.]